MKPPTTKKKNSFTVAADSRSASSKLAPNLPLTTTPTHTPDQRGSNANQPKARFASNPVSQRSSMWNPVELQQFQKSKAIATTDSSNSINPDTSSTNGAPIGSPRSARSGFRPSAMSLSKRRSSFVGLGFGQNDPNKAKVVPDAMNVHHRTKKKTMFASVKPGQGMTLSRGDTQKANQLKFILEAKQKQRQSLLLLEIAEIKEEDEINDVETNDNSNNDNNNNNNNNNNNELTAPIVMKYKMEEPLTLNLEDLQNDGIDPESTFLLIENFPYIILAHDSVLAGRIETFVILLVVFQSFQFPLEIAFTDEVLGQTIQILGSFTASWDIITYVIFIFDFFHNFFKTYCDSMGDLVIDGNSIARQYFYTVWFWVDFISCLPFELLGGDEDKGSSFLKTLKLLRMCRMGKLLKKIDTVYKAGALRLIRIMSVIVLVFHWISCGWFLVGKSWLALLKGFQFDHTQVPYNFTEVSERSERALMKTRILATKCTKWLQT